MECLIQHFFHNIIKTYVYRVVLHTEYSADHTLLLLFPTLKKIPSVSSIALSQPPGIFGNRNFLAHLALEVHMNLP